MLHFRDLLHAANLRHGTDAFTSPLKEGVLRLQPGLNPQTWVPKASRLPLDHQSRKVIWLQTATVFWLDGATISPSY